MGTKQFRVELTGSDDNLLVTLRSTEAALGRNERAYGTLAQQMARTGSQGVAFQAAQQAQVRSSDALAEHLTLAATASQRFEKQQSAAAAASEISAQKQQAVAQAGARLTAATGAPTVLGPPSEERRLAALAGIRQAAQEKERATYAAHQNALSGIRDAAANHERDTYRAQQAFLASLNRTVVGEEAARGGRSARAALLELQAAQLGVADKARPMIQRVEEADKRLSGFGKTGKLAAFQLQQVGFQLNDFAVQVASGQSPLIALVQQGSQLSGTFGGIRPAISALLSLLTPARLLVGGVAAGVGTLALAYVQGQRDDQKFRDGLVLTGNAAGVTRGAFESLAVGVQAASGVTIGAARDITQQLVSTGQIGPGALGAVARAAATLARISGQSSDDVVKDFAGMASGVAQWAFEHNKSYNFLTAETYRYIKSLEAQGKAEEAMRVASQALDEALNGRARKLGVLESAWKEVTKAASEYKDVVVGLFRADTTDDQVSRTAMALVDAQAQLARGDKRAAPLVNALQARFDALRAQQGSEERAAQEAAAVATKNKADLLREQEAYQSALAGLQRSGLNLAQAQAEAARQVNLNALERSYDEALLGLAGYVKTRELLERRGIDAKRALVDQEIALERKRQPGSPQEGLDQQARVNALLARRVALETDRLKLSEQARKNFEKESLPDAPRPSDDLRRFENRDRAAEDAVDRERYIAAASAAHDLVELNRRLGIDLIRDDRARGQAQIEAEAKELAIRLDLASQSAEQRERIEGDVAEFIRLRNQQLTEQLKPEWQKLLEGWADTNRLMKETHDRFLTGFVQSGEEAWLEFNRTGRLNLASMGKLIQDELARLTYRQFIGPAVANIGQTIAGALGIKAPGTVGDAGAAAAKAAETAAVTNNTVALTALQATGVSPANAALALLSTAANAASAALSRISAGGGASGLAGLFGGGASGGGEAAIGNLGADFVAPGFAKGGVFGGGLALAFAKGGVFGGPGHVLTQPTYFAMSGGRTGLAGEAGPEAVLPLKRTASGRLGVEVSGGGESAAVRFATGALLRRGDAHEDDVAAHQAVLPLARLPDGKLGVQAAPGARRSAAPAADDGANSGPPIEVHVNLIGAPAPAKVGQARRRPDGGIEIDVLFEQFESRLGERVDNGTGLARNVSGRFALNSGSGLVR